MNMKTFAEIVDNKVVNVVLWDGVAPFDPGMELVEIPDGIHAGIGWDYIDGEFVDNRPVVEDEVN
jgi:hypothetical protein